MQRKCVVCGTSFDAKRPQAKCCGPTCRVRKSRSGGTVQTAPLTVDRPVSGLVDAVTAALDEASRRNSVAGQHAIEIANRIVNSPGMNTGVASLSKELSRIMAEALKSSGTVSNPLDELRARRDAKRAAG